MKPLWSAQETSELESAARLTSAPMPEASNEPPPWAIAGFPADVPELLARCQLEHHTHSFAETNIVSLVLQHSLLGHAAFMQHLGDCGLTKVGERMRLSTELLRASRGLQSAAALVDVHRGWLRVCARALVSSTYTCVHTCTSTVPPF